MGIYQFRREDAEDFGRFIGIRTFVRGDELHFAQCPYCKGNTSKKYKFAISLKTGQFNCKRASCDARGNMITLAQDFNWELPREAEEYYKPRRRYTFTKLTQPTEPIVPKDEAVEYMKSRGISEEICERYSITLADNGGIAMPFRDETGEIVFVKYRNPHPAEGQSKEWTHVNCKPILYGMYQCNLENKTLVVTEGQIDSLSVVQAGIENAVSVPTGAKGFTWVPYCWDWMENFEKIIIFGDHERGQITLYEDFRQRWGTKVCHVTKEDYKGCKDANEILQKYGAEQIKKCIENATQAPIPKIIDITDVEVINPFDIDKVPTGIKCIDNLLCGGLPFGQVVLVTGKAGEGKSTLVSQFLLNAVDHGHKVFAYSGELPNFLFKSWLDYQACGGKHVIEEWGRWQDKHMVVPTEVRNKINEWLRGNFYLYDNTDRLTEDEEDTKLVDLMELMINKKGVNVLLIDNLMTGLTLDMTSGTSKLEQQSNFMQRLARLALNYNVLIILVAHKRKDQANNAVNESVSGTLDIINLASIVLSYEKSRREDVAEDERLLKVTKNRLFGNTDEFGFTMKYDPSCKRIYSTEWEKNYQYCWEKAPDQEEKIEEEFDKWLWD